MPVGPSRGSVLDTSQRRSSLCRRSITRAPMWLGRSLRCASVRGSSHSRLCGTLRARCRATVHRIADRHRARGSAVCGPSNIARKLSATSSPRGLKASELRPDDGVVRVKSAHGEWRPPISAAPPASMLPSEVGSNSTVASTSIVSHLGGEAGQERGVPPGQDSRHGVSDDVEQAATRQHRRTSVRAM